MNQRREASKWKEINDDYVEEFRTKTKSIDQVNIILLDIDRNIDQDLIKER